MSDRLYFLQLMLKALQQPDQRAAFQDAFQEILLHGQESEYEEGFQNFIHFMHKARFHMEQADRNQEEIFRQKIKEWIAQIEPSKESVTLPSIELYRQDQKMGVFAPPSQGLLWGSIAGLIPGFYTLQVQTGWVLWEGDLTAEQLLWSEAFPEQSLPLAADQEGGEAVLSRRIEVLSGEMEMRVYPGLESGWAELYSTASQG